jgi:predicted nuclease of predicted toxin-antitoxin system
VPVSRSQPNASDESWASPLPEPRPLLDENLAASLAAQLADLYPRCAHVSAVGLASTRDRAIWAYAAEHGFVLVTKDEDFHRLSVLHGAPSTVIWIGLGNCSTADVARLLRESARRDIVEFADHREATFPALG